MSESQASLRCPLGLWGTTLTENTAENPELYVKTTLQELLVYIVFLVDICLGEQHLSLYMSVCEKHPCVPDVLISVGNICGDSVHLFEQAVSWDFYINNKILFITFPA